MSTSPRTRLSREEETFLRHWIYDEAHYQDGIGPAKRLQVQNRAIPADLATIIAATIPDAGEQEAAALGPPPPEAPTWPWSEGALTARVAEARAFLTERRPADPHPLTAPAPPPDTTPRSPP
jgi:hypothetical protein